VPKSHAVSCELRPAQKVYWHIQGGGLSDGRLRAAVCITPETPKATAILSEDRSRDSSRHADIWGVIGVGECLDDYALIEILGSRPSGLFLPPKRRPVTPQCRVEPLTDRGDASIAFPSREPDIAAELYWDHREGLPRRIDHGDALKPRIG